MTNRREILAATAAAAAVFATRPASAQEPATLRRTAAPSHAPLRYCLNVSTINSSQVEIEDQIRIASEAGYDGIEIWLRDIERFRQRGGKLPELRMRLEDANLRVESAIAFGQWIVDDAAQRAKGLDDCRRDMEIVRELGGRRIAAPPTGATEGPKLDLDAAADRYAALLEIGLTRDCDPQLEVWGFSKNFATLAEVLYVLAAVRNPRACVLPDVYHLYKGGSNFADIALLSGSAVHVLHMNDYPANPPRDEIGDADRVYPGDGVAPIASILRTMMANGFDGVLSLELFNRTYWKQPADQVAATGLAKMKAAVVAALA